MFNVFRVCLVALGVLLSGKSLAVDYYWYLNSYTPSPNSFSDPETACRSINLGARTQSYVTTFDRIEMISTTSYRCWYNETAVSGGTTAFNRNLTNTTRGGSTCPTNTTYNASTGLCDAPEQSLCEQAQGSKTIYYFETDLSQSLPNTIDINGCVGKLSGWLSCPVETSGHGVCSGEFIITGEETTASTSVAGAGTDCSTDCNPPYPQTESSELPCDPTTDPATGASVCTSESHFSEPGTMTCGTADGELVCTENPKSRSQDKTVETTTSTTTNPDGSTSTTTTTITNKTDCVGINGCTSSTTTETKTGGTNADGSAKSDTTSCTGEGCTAPEDLPAEQSAPLPSGELQQPAERGNFTDELAEWDQMIADSRVDLRSKFDQMAELVTAETALSISGSSGQLYCQSVTLPGLGSSFDICLDDYQDELAGIKWILIFMATVLAFYIIFVRD